MTPTAEEGHERKAKPNQVHVGIGGWKLVTVHQTLTSLEGMGEGLPNLLISGEMSWTEGTPTLPSWAESRGGSKL